MPERQQTVDALIEAGAVAVIRLADSRKMIPVVEALKAGGLRGIEITMTVPNALDVLADVHRAFGGEILLGVGSVLDVQTARAAVQAGARFVVSPVFKPAIIDTAHALDAAALPGCFTPTEIQQAHEAGADIVKVFPADVVGMAFFKAVRAPMPHLKLMPTGGVTLTNAGEWLRHGACAVGVGGALLDKQAIADGNFDKLTENARTLMASIATGQSSRM